MLHIRLHMSVALFATYMLSTLYTHTNIEIVVHITARRERVQFDETHETNTSHEDDNDKDIDKVCVRTAAATALW